MYMRISTLIRNPTCPKTNSYFSTFEEICPQWSTALRLGYAINQNLDVQDAKSCIVGEAYGFRKRYLLCSKCWEYSQSFTLCVYGNKAHRYGCTDYQAFEELKSNFVFHFNKRHILKRSCRSGFFGLLFSGVTRLFKKLKVNARFVAST
jgi:hypothetical protein